MTNEEIVGGIRIALERGESLKRAMMTFFNAGYKKEEIEEAARFVNENPTEYPKTSSVVQVQKKGLFGQTIKEKIPEKKIISSQPIVVPQAPIQSSSQPAQQIVSNYGEQLSIPANNNPQVKQIISNYGEKQNLSQPVQKVSNYIDGKSKDKIIVIILIALLIFLLGLLASIFLFKTEIINFFSNLVS
jgi:hypothetical protein